MTLNGVIVLCLVVIATISATSLKRNPADEDLFTVTAGGPGWDITDEDKRQIDEFEIRRVTEILDLFEQVKTHKFAHLPQGVALVHKEPNYTEADVNDFVVTFDQTPDVRLVVGYHGLHRCVNVRPIFRGPECDKPDERLDTFWVSFQVRRHRINSKGSSLWVDSRPKLWLDKGVDITIRDATGFVFKVQKIAKLIKAGRLTVDDFDCDSSLGTFGEMGPIIQCPEDTE